MYAIPYLNYQIYVFMILTILLELQLKCLLNFLIDITRQPPENS
jgi:hypothetical protein